MQYKYDTVNGLPVLTDHKLTPVYGAEAAAQALWFRLMRIRGEWCWDLESGLPWLDWTERPNPNLAAIRQVIQTEALKVRDVTAVSSIDVTFDRPNNTLHVALRAVASGTTIEVSI